jgi:hypothetical protein
LLVLLTAFIAWGISLRADPDQLSSTTVGAKPAPAADKYTPESVLVARGPQKGQLNVSWSMPIRPDVVATVIYEGSGTAKARAVVNYNGRQVQPQVTVRGLPSGQEICLSATNVVSLEDAIINAPARPVCATPR